MLLRAGSWKFQQERTNTVCHPRVRPSKAEDLIFKLAHRSRLLVTDGFGGLFHGADHWWRTADQDLNVIRWWWQMLLRNM